jgi:hypothetical protein
MQFDLRTIYRSLASNDFSLNQEFIITLKGMFNSREKIKNDYSTIREVFQDKKLSWNEIDQLNHFLTITIPESWNDNCSDLELLIKSFKSRQFIIFEPIQYIEDIHYRAFPDGYDSEKKFHYFLNGQKLQPFIQEVNKIIDTDKEQLLDSKEFFVIENKLKEFFQKLGKIAETTPPYLLITSNGSETDPMHPLKITEELHQLGDEIKNEFKRLPSKELLSLSNEAAKGLNEFMKGKKLQDDEFKANSFWGTKKGITEIYNLFRFLEDTFEFEDRFHFY